MASKKAKELWESGIWLSDAWKTFAPVDLVVQFKESRSLLQAFTDGPTPKDLAGIGRKASDAFAQSQKRQILERKMKEAVLLQLFNGDLIATAYRESPSPSRYAIAIDSDKFDFDDPDWDNQSHSAQGFRYGRIKVSRPLPKRQAAKGKNHISAIDHAIAELAIIHANFCTQARKTSCQYVRDFLGVTHTPGDGLSDKSIEKAVLRKCGSKRIASISI